MTLVSTLRGAALAAPATLGIAVLSLLAFALTSFVPGAFDVLTHDDTALAQGDIWRLVTAHLVHLDLAHLGPNLIGLPLLGIALERHIGARRLIGLLGLSGLAISAGVVLDPGLARYCGLSGVLNALFAALCLVRLRDGPHVLWSTLFLAGAAKIAWESANPPLFSDGLTWPPHVLSHAVGYAVGTVFAIGHLNSGRSRRTVSAS